MNTETQGITALFALFSALVGGYSCTRLLLDRRARLQRRKRSRSQELPIASSRGLPFGQCLLRYAERVSHDLSFRAYAPLSPAVRLRRAASSKAAEFIELHAMAAGCAQRLTPEGFLEVRFRLMCACAAVGALMGALFSLPLSIVLGCVGCACGNRALERAMLDLEKQRAFEAESNISHMLEVIALGLRSGLTFDRSFELYCVHFDSAFARDCASSYRSWSMGLSSREEALSSLAESYRCEELSRATTAILRSLRFGSSFSENLEELAAQSRANHRASVAEKVAKAPVKMMLPTGTLILPVMLLLVLGPVILEFVQGF